MQFPWKQTRSDSSPSSTRLTEIQSEAAERIFAAIDTDGSGGMTKNELVEVHGGDVKAILEVLDANKDGLVSANEWLGFLHRMKAHRGDKALDQLLGTLLRSCHLAKSPNPTPANPAQPMRCTPTKSLPKPAQTAPPVHCPRLQELPSGGADPSTQELLHTFRPYVRKLFTKYAQVELRHEQLAHGAAGDANADDKTISVGEFVAFGREFGLCPTTTVAQLRQVFDLSLPGSSSTESLDLDSFENALVGLAVGFFAPSQDEAGQLVAFFQTLALSKGHEVLQDEAIHQSAAVKKVEAAIFKKSDAYPSSNGVQRGNDSDGIQMLSVSSVFTYYASRCDPGNPNCMNMHELRTFVKDAQLLLPANCAEQTQRQVVSLVDVDILFKDHTGAGAVDPSTSYDGQSSHSSELSVEGFTHVLASLAAMLDITFAQFVNQFVEPLMSQVETAGIGQPNMKVNALYRKHRALLLPVFKYYAKSREASVMKKKGHEKIQFQDKQKQDDYLHADRFQLFCMECAVARRVSNVNSSEVFRRVLNAIAHGDPSEFGSLCSGVPYQGFQHCLTLLADEVATNVTHGEPILDTLEGRIVYLLELIAVSDGVALVEEQMTKSLQLAVKHVLDDGVARRACAAKLDPKATQFRTKSEPSAKWSPAKSLSQVRLESSKSHLQPSSTASGIMSSRTKLEQDSGVEVNEAYAQAMNELKEARSYSAAKGDLETALECTRALSQLKEDVLEAHNNQIKEQLQEDSSKFNAGWSAQRAELQAIWDGHKAKYQDTVSDEISCLQEQQMHERTQYCNDVSRISMTAFSIKSAGMNLGEWAEANVGKKLRPSARLLDLDKRYSKAMAAHRYALADELKQNYETQAIEEWRAQTQKEESEWHCKSSQLEAHHRQQMEALWVRHRSCRSELEIKAKKELDMCDRFWKKKLETLRKTALHNKKQRPMY